MNIEKQVASLIQCNRLKELGLTAKAYFGWCVFCPDPTGERYYYEIVSSDSEDTGNPGEYLAHAYNVSELGAMLSEWMNEVLPMPESLNRKYGYDVSLVFNPQFLSDLLICCIESGSITIDHCNSILSTN